MTMISKRCSSSKSGFFKEVTSQGVPTGRLIRLSEALVTQIENAVSASKADQPLAVEEPLEEGYPPL